MNLAIAISQFTPIFRGSKKLLLSLAITLTIITGVNAQFTLTDSLKAHYPFNNNANDESGNKF